MNARFVKAHFQTTMFLAQKKTDWCSKSDHRKRENLRGERASNEAQRLGSGREAGDCIGSRTSCQSQGAGSCATLTVSCRPVGSSSWDCLMPYLRLSSLGVTKRNLQSGFLSRFAPRHEALIRHRRQLLETETGQKQNDKHCSPTHTITEKRTVLVVRPGGRRSWPRRRIVREAALLHPKYFCYRGGTVDCTLGGCL